MRCASAGSVLVPRVEGGAPIELQHEWLMHVGEVGGRCRELFCVSGRYSGCFPSKGFFSVPLGYIRAPFFVGCPPSPKRTVGFVAFRDTPRPAGQ